MISGYQQNDLKQIDQDFLELSAKPKVRQIKQEMLNIPMNEENEYSLHR